MWLPAIAAVYVEKLKKWKVDLDEWICRKDSVSQIQQYIILKDNLSIHDMMNQPIQKTRQRFRT